MINSKNKPLIIFTGPTAVGKTAMSIRLAKELNGEIISADSAQVYKYMDIGSAKITKEEMQGVVHYLIDVLEPSEEFNIATFKDMALCACEEIYEKGKLPIIVGGTGFYIQSLIYDIDFSEESEGNSKIRDELEKIYEDNGADFLHNMLRECDAESAELIHKNNVKRVIRAIEYYRLTGEKISDHNKTQHEKSSPYNFAYFVLNEDRKSLYEKIDKRVDMMFEAGLVNEVTALKNMGLSKANTSMLALGYKEVLDYLEGEISIEAAKEIIKRDTRHFAKRQITWCKREKDVIWLNKEKFDYNEDKIIETIKENLRVKGII